MVISAFSAVLSIIIKACGNLDFSIRDLSSPFSSIKKKKVLISFFPPFHDILKICVPKQMNILFSTDSF